MTKNPKNGLMDVTVETVSPCGEKNTELLTGVDCLLWAIGRKSSTEKIGLEKVVSWPHDVLTTSTSGHGGSAI